MSHPVVALQAALLVVCLSTVAGAQMVQLEPSGDLEEFVDSKEQVSGGSTVGVVYIESGEQNEPRKIDPASLYAKFDEPTMGTLQLRVSSADGRYSGVANYEITSPVSGWLQLAFPTQHSAFISNYNTDNFAGLLEQTGSNKFIPLRWGSGAATELVRVYINSERAKAFFYDESGGKRAVAYCNASTAEAGFKFNSVCDIPAEQVHAQSGVKVHRKFGIRSVDAITVDVLVSGAEGGADGGE